jgi:hypothetical protein
MTPAHIGGVPIEEFVPALAPAGAAILTAAMVLTRAKLAAILGWLRHH